MQLRETSYNRRYIALARRAQSLITLERFKEAEEDIEVILSTADIAVEQKMAARLMRAELVAGVGDSVIAEAELKQVMASRRNFPDVVEAATALAGDLGMLSNSTVAASVGTNNESNPPMIGEQAN